MKLFYFDLPVRGEAIRLLLRHAKIPFQDIRIPMHDWGFLKFSSLVEYHQLPVLELPDGTRLSQSQCILEYLGMTYGYLQFEEKMIYECKNIMDAVEDLTSTIGSILTPPPQNQFDELTLAEKKKTLFSKDIPFLFSKFENKLVDNVSQQYFVGNSYSIADFSALQLFHILIFPAIKETIMQMLLSYKNLNSYFELRMKDFADQSVKPTAYKLYYFDFPGRAECIRLLFHHAKVQFEDYRMSFEQFAQESATDKFEFKQLPVLEENGVMYSQTEAILQRLGLKYGYLPTDAKTLYRVVNIMNAVKDLIDGLAKAQFSKITEENKKKTQDGLLNNSIPLIFSVIENKIKANISKDFLVGCNFTVADFAFLGFARGNILKPNLALFDYFSKLLEKYPLTKNYLQIRNEEFNKLNLK